MLGDFAALPSLLFALLAMLSFFAREVAGGEDGLVVVEVEAVLLQALFRDDVVASQNALSLELGGLVPESGKRVGGHGTGSVIAGARACRGHYDAGAAPRAAAAVIAASIL